MNTEQPTLGSLRWGTLTSAQALPRGLGIRTDRVKGLKMVIPG